MGRVGEEIATIATAIVGVAILAVIVSRNANTSGVITAAGNAFSGALRAAEGPVLSTSGSYAYTGGAGVGFNG